MMTGGPGWGELFMQDPITKEKQKVGVVEELTTQCLETNISVKNTNTIYCDDNLATIQYMGDAILSKDEIREICKEYIEEKEKKEMDNKIVDLYYERKNEEIKNKYVELLKKEYEELDVVKEYNELINTFEASLAELAGRYNTEETRVLIKTGYTDTYTYELNSNLKDALKDAHREEYDKEVNALRLLVEEVRAVLSVSNDDDYRIGVLTEYGIITKKGKLNV